MKNSKTLLVFFFTIVLTHMVFAGVAWLLSGGDFLNDCVRSVGVIISTGVIGWMPACIVAADFNKDFAKGIDIIAQSSTN